MQPIAPRLNQWIVGLRELQRRKGSQKFWLDENVQEIQRRLIHRGWFRQTNRSLAREDVGTISNRLQSLSFWYAREGMLAVWDGDNDGWRDIQRALLYRYWDSRLFRQLWPNGSDDIFMLSDQAHAFCHALAVGQDEVARWMGNDLYEQSLPARQTIFESGRVENFALWIYGLWTGKSIYFTQKSLGEYQLIVDAWNGSGDTLRDRWSQLLDWRLDHTNEADPNDEKLEWGYDTQPYDCWPVELLAAERVRREQGLEVVRPDHPLLQTPLANPPYPLPLPEDELVERAVAAVRKVYPNL